MQLFHPSKSRLFVLLAFFTWSSFAFCDEINDAARHGDLENVRALLKNHPDLVSSSNSAAGMTPLHWAVRFSHKDVADLLLANKANVNVTDQYGRTPLLFATFDGDKKMAETLLQSNAAVDLKDRQGHSPLRWAVDKNDIGMMELLLAHKADVNTKDNNGFTPLGYATGTNAAKLLLANKADVNARDTTGRGGGGTPLHWAAREGKKPVVELLLASNADVNAKDNSTNTPLQFAFHNKDIAVLLRQHGGHGNAVTTKPLVGWYLDGDSDSQHDKAIIDDYQAYAHKVWPKDRDFFISKVDFYEDGTGRHAVRIELEPGSRKYVEYYLMYDTNNVRTKVIKGKTWHQFHM